MGYITLVHDHKFAAVSDASPPRLKGLPLFYCLYPQNSTVHPVGTPASRPKRCSVAAGASPWGTACATAACPATSWTATPRSPACSMPATRPCGTSPLPSAEVHNAAPIACVCARLGLLNELMGGARLGSHACERVSFDVCV